MYKLLIPLIPLIALSAPVAAQEQPKKPMCLPFKEMTDGLQGMGFLPLFGSNNDKAGTMVFVQGKDKVIAIVIFDTGGNACLATMQENLRLNNENYEAITSELIGKKA